jgi:uncharacterized damage-inducible protein DinB
MSRLIYVGQGLSLVPATLTRLVRCVDSARIDTRLAENRFTLREVLAHMADMEPVIRGRMELALRSPGSNVENWDQDQNALDKNYAAWEVGPTLELFSVEREKTCKLFEALTIEQIKLTVHHPILGEVTIFDLACFLLGHDTYHLDQISEYLD